VTKGVLKGKFASAKEAIAKALRAPTGVKNCFGIAFKRLMNVDKCIIAQENCL
jgi:hypothetical protein